MNYQIGRGQGADQLVGMQQTSKSDRESEIGGPSLKLSFAGSVSTHHVSKVQAVLPHPAQRFECIVMPLVPLQFG